MPTVTKCKNGHLYDAEVNESCPYCSSVVEPPPPPPPPAPKSKLPWIVAGAAIVATLFCFSNWKDAESKLEDYNKMKTAGKLLKTVIGPFGTGSSAFKAEIPVLILDRDGKTDSISFSKPDSSSSTCRFLSDSINWTGNNGTSSKWSSSLCDDIKMEWKGTDLLVTPGHKTGYNIIHFWNSKDSTVFDVLVVVK